MNEQIQFTINDIKYILIEYPLMKNVDNKKFDEAIDRLGCIYQGLTVIKPSTFWIDGLAAIKLLIPEANIIEFNKLKLTK